MKGNVERRRGFLPPSLRVPPAGGEVLTIERVAPFALFSLMLLALLLPLGPLAANRFHHDEALYSTWALLIASGRDPLLNTVPVDKPPLFLYTVALFFKIFGVSETVARLPSLLATMSSVGLLFALGRRLYDTSTGLLAAALFTLSPFTILFAPTALTDPMLVAFVLAACGAAAAGRLGWAGVALGLAFATKQQAVFFAPLVLGLAWAFDTRPEFQQLRGEVLGSPPPSKPPPAGGRLFSSPPAGGTEGGRAPHQLARFDLRKSRLLKTGLAFAVPAALVFLWDAARSQRLGFLGQSALSYGGLSLDPASFGQRLADFVELLRYAAPAVWLQTIFLVGLPFLLLAGIYKMHTRQAIVDWFLALFCLFFLVGHAAFSFEVWDRYLLGLVPLLALLLARILLWPWRLGIADRVLEIREPRSGLTHTISGLRSPVSNLQSLISNPQNLILVFVLALAFVAPVQDAVASRYPIGGDHGAYQGVDDVAAYLRGHAGANVTLYHRWLGTHWRFYLWEYPFDFQRWQTESELAALAAQRAGSTQYIAFPAWRSETMARLALAEAGLTLREVYRAYRPDGAPSISLYQIEPVQ